MTQLSTALRGIYSVPSSNLFTQEYPAMKRTNIPGALVALFAITTLGCGGNNAPGQTFARGDLEISLQFPSICEQATGKPDFCDSPVTIGLMADLGDKNKDGVTNVWEKSVALTRADLTAVATVADVPLNDEQVMDVTLVLPAMPEGFEMQHASGAPVPQPFTFFPNIETGDETQNMDKALRLRIVAVGGKGAQCVKDDDCQDMMVCISGTCTGGNGEGEGCGVNDPCLDGLECVDNKCIDPCLSDAECGAKEICNADGKCIAVPCKVDADCADGEWCDEANHTCHDGCSQDSDCPNGQSCDTVKHECVDQTPECTTDDQCGEKQICDDMMCVDVECTTNEHCADTQICDLLINECKEIEQADFCTRPLHDTQDPNLDPNKYGNFFWAFGTNEEVKDGEKELGFNAVMGNDKKCLEFTVAQKESLEINIDNGPKYNGQPLCTRPDLNKPNVIKCSGPNLPPNEIPTGTFTVSGSFGNGVLNVGVVNDTVSAPWVKEYFLAAFGG